MPRLGGHDGAWVNTVECHLADSDSISERAQRADSDPGAPRVRYRSGCSNRRVDVAGEAGSMAVSQGHGAACYRSMQAQWLSPLSAVVRPRRKSRARQGRRGCAFKLHSPEVGSSGSLVHLACCDIGSESGPCDSGSSLICLLVVLPLLLAGDSGSSGTSSFGGFATIQ